MALDPTDGTRRTRRDRAARWAYMRVGYKSRKKAVGKGGVAGTVRGKPVYKWVRVGSSFYNQLRAKGVKPTAIRRTRSGAQPSPDTRDRLGGRSGRQKKAGTKALPKRSPERMRDSKIVRRATRPGGTKAGGGKGGNKNNRKKSLETQKAVGQQLGKTSVGKRLGGNYAGAMAGMQFDAPIHDLKVLIERLGPQNRQAIADIENWYGDVSQLNSRAGSRAAEIASTVAASQDEASRGLLAALGGGANDAGALLAASGLRDSGYTRALGGIEQQYHADMDPILAHAEANAKTLEQRRNLEQMQDYQLQLAQMLGQRGQAKAAFQMEVDRYNNELAQQNFQNKLARLNAALGAQAAGVDLAAKRAALRAQRSETRKSKGGVVNWRGLNPAERDDLLLRAIGARQKPNGAIVPTRTLGQAQRWLTSNLKFAVGSGKNPGLLTMLRQYYR